VSPARPARSACAPSPAQFLSRPLRSQRRIHLPGAHNSAAYKLNHYALAPAGGAHPDWVGWLNSHSPTVTVPVSQLAVPWADCQGETVADQLRHGVRYLDLRAVWVESSDQRRELGLGEGGPEWLVTHTLLGGPIEDVFIQVAAFLREHTKEVVLLDLQHVKAAPTAEAHARLLGQLEKHLHVDGRMAPSELGVDVTYGEMVARGYQCIVFYPFDTADADFPGVGIGAFARKIGCWHRGGGTLRSPWPQVGTLEALLRKLGPLCQEAGEAGGFFVLQGVVTPDAAMVAAGLLGLPNRPRCLRELAEVVTVRAAAPAAAPRRLTPARRSRPWRRSAARTRAECRASSWSISCRCPPSCLVRPRSRRRPARVPRPS